MKEINTAPETIRTIFSKNYEIPDFQRPYSWDNYQVNQLWEDFTTFYSDNKNKPETYYFGNIIVYEENDKRLVIDGQQRLTTLLLLIKALFEKAGSYTELEICLKKADKRDRKKLKNELRVVSKVEVKEDQKNLEKLILHNNREGKSQQNKNFECLIKKLEEWQNSTDRDSEKLNELIDTLLDKVVLLPIRCENEDDALSIFQTINDRGMSLDDSDIFKAQLYSKAKKERKEKEFVKRWGALKDHLWLFRIHMHIQRAEDNIIAKEKALRAYFQEKGKDRLKDYNVIMKSLETYYNIIEYWKKPYEIDIWWKILETYPNQYYNYPLFVFLHEHRNRKEDVFSIDKKTETKFLTLVKETVKYCFINGLAYNNVNTIKDTIFKVCKAIYAKEDYLSIYKDKFQKEFEDCKRKLENNDYGRYRKGLVLLASFLNKKQNNEEYLDTLNNYNIEHIMPRKCLNYLKIWTEDLYKEKLDKLGNLIPLEKKKNIQASNKYFINKKTIYEDSKVQDVRNLSAKIEHWRPDDLETRHQEVMRRLKKFFKGGL